MKCRECSYCYKGYWASEPEVYVCVYTDKPFEIIDVNYDCEYESRMDGDENA